MSKIAIISCGKNKAKIKAKARDLYLGSSFKMGLSFALKHFDDKNIYILSAKHGLLKLDQEIEPYEKSLIKAGESEKKLFALKIIDQIKTTFDRDDEIYFFVSYEYIKYVLTHIEQKFLLPLKNKRQGFQRKYFKEEIL